ncbi:ATP-binding protein [Streptomyces sp. NBC_01465]|uniref:ATP-binding protein n=1 Tax=Streptomyces sp. NBC_01465 TaxID=2903878 RepID=UPI002E37F84E|nr:ATP-binding protein [Streptomyces sp. NBC_01465]
MHATTTLTPTYTRCPEPLQPDGHLPTLAYSLTLPAAPRSAAVARIATASALRAHNLTPLTDPAVLATSELTATAAKFSPPDAEIYLSLRHRDDAIRVIVYDAHPRHTNPRLAAACDARRRASLRVLACLVKACGGTWGLGPAHEPTGGTRTWAVLPTRSTTTYTITP